MQTLFKSNLFSKSSSKVGAKNFLSGGKKLGSSIVGAARNNIIGFNRTAKAMVPQKKEENENSFIKNYTNFFGSKKTEKILRKNLKLVRDSLVNTFEIARHLKAVIVDITKSLKGKDGKGGGLLGGLIKSFLGGLFGGALIAALPFLLKLAAIGSIAGIAIALWKSKAFRDAAMAFIEFAADKIWNLLKPAFLASMRWMFGETEHSKEIKKALNPKAISEYEKEHGTEKTLEMMRDLYAENKESGFLDSFRAKRDGIEDEFFRRMTDVERRLSKEQGTKNIVSIRDKEIEIRTKEIRDDRLKTKEWREIQDLPGNDPNKTKLQTAYHKETKRMIREMNDEIWEKYKQILLKGADGGSIHESMIKGRQWEGTSAFDQRESSSSTSSDSNSEGLDFNKFYNDKFGETNNKETSFDNLFQNQNVEGVKSNINSIDSISNLYSDAFSGEPTFNLEPFTFNLSQGQDSSGSGGITNTSGGTTSSGNAVTFYSSSNSDPTYHKLNALMTFNII